MRSRPRTVAMVRRRCSRDGDDRSRGGTVIPDGEPDSGQLGDDTGDTIPKLRRQLRSYAYRALCL